MFYLIAAAAVEAAKTSGFDLKDIAAVVTAIGGIIVGVIAARKGARADKAKEEQAEQTTILSSYGQIVKDLQGEVERIRKMYTEDSAIWRIEKETLLNQIKLMQERDLTESATTRRRRKARDTNDPEDPT